MTAILYPVAETAEAALHTPRGYAEREREAAALAGDAVAFASEAMGPAFATREAAVNAYSRRLAAEEASEYGFQARWRQLIPVSAPAGDRTAAAGLVRPTYRDGRRWPTPAGGTVILWRLSVSYWRIGSPDQAGSNTPASAPSDAARRLRRGEAGRELSGMALNALARQPLRPFKLQQPLDIGLFEIHPPEAPDTVMPDD